MSTRSNIVINDGNRLIWLYRHSDGYPHGEHGVLLHLEQILEACDYNTPELLATALIRFKIQGSHGEYYSFELTEDQHGDIEYLYTINAKDKTISYRAII